MRRLTRILAAVLAAGLAAGTLTACSGGSKVKDGNYPVSTDYFKTLGRYAIEEDTLWFSFSASGIEFDYDNCTTCTIDLAGDTMAGAKTESAHHPRYAVYVNDEQVIDAMLDSAAETITVPLTEKSGTVRLVKLSESSDSSMGIKGIHVDGTISPSADKDLKIEFIGDSITCGYGVDGELGDTYSTSNENATKSYAYKTAQKLDADYSMVSFSGYGIYSGYTTGNEANTAQTLPQYYTKVGNSYGQLLTGSKVNEIEWDFSLFVPDYVVINLGTNDASFCKSAEEKENYVSKYVEFLKLVREKNPDATIVCTLGIMGQDLFLSLQEAVGKYQTETGDENITFMEFDVQSDGYVVDYHPTETTHDKASDKLAAFLQDLIASKQ